MAQTNLEALNAKTGYSELYNFLRSTSMLTGTFEGNVPNRTGLLENDVLVIDKITAAIVEAELDSPMVAGWLGSGGLETMRGPR